jgi:phosphatidate cytidylyltransferase
MRDTRGSTLQRLVTAMAIIPAVIAMIWVPALDHVFVVFIAALAWLGLREFHALAAARGIVTRPAVGALAGTAVVMATWWPEPSWVALVLFLAILAVIVAHLAQGAHTLAGLSASVFGVVYVGWLPAHFPLIHRASGDGPGLVMLLAVAVVLSDTGAYFAGRALGRNKMAPVLSPNKTWEGAVGGVVAALLGMAVLYGMREGLAWSALPGWALEKYLFVGAVLAVAAQVGDLLESMLKRDAGVKDSGTLFPGHGGVLDRCDGFLLAAPALYLLLKL